MFSRKMKIDKKPSVELLATTDKRSVFQWKRKWDPKFASAPVAVKNTNIDSSTLTHHQSLKRQLRCGGNHAI